MLSVWGQLSIHPEAPHPFFGRPHEKDASTSGSMLQSLYLWKTGYSKALLKQASARKCPTESSCLASFSFLFS